MTKQEIINRAMKARGIEDRELSRRTGIHVTLIRRYLKGEVEVGARNGPKLARELGISLEDLLCGDDEEEPEGAPRPSAAPDAATL